MLMGERSGRGCYQVDMSNDTGGGLDGAVRVHCGAENALGATKR